MTSSQHPGQPNIAALRSTLMPQLNALAAAIDALGVPRYVLAAVVREFMQAEVVSEPPAVTAGPAIHFDVSRTVINIDRLDELPPQVRADVSVMLKCMSETRPALQSVASRHGIAVTVGVVVSHLLEIFAALKAFEGGKQLVEVAMHQLKQGYETGGSFYDTITSVRTS